MPTMHLYNVYERRGRVKKHYIGSVEARNKQEAVDIAHQKYGAPIIVEGD